ncbi:hypothetical protein FB45DRAFT_873982 [Roridomyces roridus]|uniref:Uncharacterized protein n=1 Tax=Roridomyces roridus TaxID=1738132 RepID=A0AAD7FDV5_9AGAR|nr:hypothetical protein FB45DRAFT_873982 [Roridomyces roridus]
MDTMPKGRGNTKELQGAQIYLYANAELLGALKDLDLAQTCSIFKPETEYHLEQHKYGLVKPKWFAEILDWIKKAPSPPPDLIRSWEQQQKAVEQCYACLREMNPDIFGSDKSDSGSDIFDSDDD